VVLNKLELNGDDPRDEIARLETQIDELVARIESCRKFIVAGWIAAVGGSVGLIGIFTKST
jgi:hypothetical protein